MSLLRTTLAAAAVLALAAVPARAQQRAADEPETQPVLLNRRDLPRLVNRAYPAELQMRKVPGSVDVRMKILPDGTVDSTSVTVESATDTQFGPAAVRVVRQLRFRPATLGGEPVAVWVSFPVAFAPRGDGTSTTAQRDDRAFKDNLPPATGGTAP